jgi:transposase
MERVLYTFEDLKLIPKQHGIYAIHSVRNGMQYIGRGPLHDRLPRHKLHATRGDTYLPIYTVMHSEGLAAFRIEVVYVQENYDIRSLAAMEKATISDRATIATLYNRHQHRKQTVTSKRIHMLVLYDGQSARRPRIIAKKLSGIYKIYHECAPDKVYIGQSTNIKGRYSAHIYKVRCEDAHSTELYQDMHRFGIEQFCFEVVEVCPKEQLLERERYWIQFYHSLEAGYNDKLPQTREELTLEINARLARGEQVTDIAKVCEVSGNTVRRVKARGEWKQLVEGMLTKKGKVYDERTIRAVRIARAEGYNTNELMEKFGLTHKALEAILLGGYWQDITLEEQPVKKVRSIKSDFTDEERREIKALLLLGTPLEEMQKQYGLCKEYLKQILNGKCWTDITVEPDLSFTKKSTSLTREMVAHIKYFLSRGLTYNELARLYDVNPSPIKSIWRGKTWHEVFPSAPGDAEEIITRYTEMRASLKRKLTEESVAYIKYYLLKGMSVKELAQRYGVGTTTIGKIRDGELWARVRSFAPGNVQ